MVLTTQTELLARAFRVIMAFIDNIVYWAVTEIYGLIDQISRINVFSESTISEFGERIYTIIGVLMLFKLASSIISYIVDPDKLTDSKKGFSSIVKNIVIMLVLIVTVPLIFRYAMALQYVVVSDDTIGRLITGKEGVEHNNTGNYMAVSILSNFIYPDSGIEGYPEGGCSYHEEHADGEQNDCEKALSKYSQYDLDKKFHDAFTTERGYSDLIALATSPAKMGDGEYVIVYRPILSTLVGGFTAWILLMFCIDIAVRIVKLGFLQLIAPIPIVTYMDDGGQGMFKKWVKTCTSTYADLFIRLAAINFAIFIITSVIDNNFKMCSWSFADGTLSATCNERPKMLVQLFLILGSLMFAKQLPKLIEEITGLKLDGKFSLNPVKKLAEVPIAGAALGAGLGALDSKIHGGNWWEGARRGIGAVGLGGSAKSLKDLTPMRQDMLKKRTEGRNAIKSMNNQMTKGEKLFNQYGNDLPSSAFSNEEFRKSYNLMDTYKKQMYEAERAQTDAQAQLNAAYNSGDQDQIEAARKYYEEKAKAYGSAKSRFSMAEKQHNIIRGMYTKDAELQDAYDLYAKTHYTASAPQAPNVGRNAGAATATTSRSSSAAPSSSSASVDVDPLAEMSEVQSQMYNPPQGDVSYTDQYMGEHMPQSQNNSDFYEDIFDQ